MAIIYPDMYNHPEKYNTGNTENHFNLRNDQINVNTPERILSVIGGAILFSSGVKSMFKNPVWGLSKLVAGGTLLMRGSTGHCPG